MQSANVEVGEHTYYDREWWNWPIELVTDHARAIMTGAAAELDRIAIEHGLRG